MYPIEVRRPTGGELRTARHRWSREETIDGWQAAGVAAGNSVPRPLTKRERLADACVHGVATAAGLVGVAVLMIVAVPQRSIDLTLSLVMYGGGLMTMLVCAALYNGFGAAYPDGMLRLDHAAIFLMIAGTYTPFLLLELPGTWSRWLLSYVWIVAGVGAALKLIWVNRFTRLSVLLYLFLGWTIVVATGPLIATISPVGIALLGIGGVLYSVGVLFHLWESLPYQQPIWHGFVAVAAACHYAAVLREVALPAGPS